MNLPRHIPKKSLKHHSAKRASSTSVWLAGEDSSRLIKTASFLVPLVGGVLVLLFVISIGQLPSLDLTGSIALLTAVALFGLAIIGCIGGATVLPALLEISIGDGSDRKRRTLYLLLSSVPAWLTLAFLLMLWLFDHYKLMSIVPSSAAFISSVLALTILCGAGICWHQTRRTLSPKTGSRWERTWTLTVTSLYWTYISMVWSASFGATSYFIYYLSADPSVPWWQRVFVGTVWLLTCMAINSAIAGAGTGKAAMRGAVVAVGLALVPLLLTKSLTDLSGLVLNRLGLADLQVRLVVTEEGCNILNSAVRGGPVCVVDPSTKLASVCPVVLKSRIGSPYRLDFYPLGPDGKWPAAVTPQSVPLSEQYVKSWPSLDMSPRPISIRSVPDQTTGLPLTASKVRNKAEADWIDAKCRG
ncbi:hypothetical protein ACSFA7_33255 [Variovorax sp. LT1R20]|uniref:hypothetical protein n=1 Tax=Variovorax sp. LT1R20 TaxID=3443729 RepID=UPI003F475B12